MARKKRAKGPIQLRDDCCLCMGSYSMGKYGAVHLFEGAEPPRTCRSGGGGGGGDATAGVTPWDRACATAACLRAPHSAGPRPFATPPRVTGRACGPAVRVLLVSVHAAAHGRTHAHTHTHTH